MEIKSIRTRVFKENEDLTSFLIGQLPPLKEKSVVVVTSKIVALSESRTVIWRNSKTKEKLIKMESEFAIKTKYTWLTIKDGTVMASAGIDESNADGKLILLPRNSFRSAEYIRNELRRKFKLKNLGVLITDSRLLPLRAGVVGVALGYAGFCGINDYRGTPDIFGRILRLSKADAADSLATAAVLIMGEGAERQPLAIITKAPVKFQGHVDRNELMIDPKEDIYQPLFEKINKIKWNKKKI